MVLSLERVLSGRLRLSYRQPDRASRVRLLALCWAGFILVFFTFSTTQEYYSMPCLSGAGAVARLGHRRHGVPRRTLLPLCHPNGCRHRHARRHRDLHDHAGSCVALPAPGDISAALSQNPDLYTLSLGHMTDLTLRAFAYLRLPLAVAGVAFLVGAVGAWRGEDDRCAFAMMMVLFFHAARLALVVFDPYMASRPLAEELLRRPPAS